MEEHECIIGEWLGYEDAELVTFAELKEKVKENDKTFEYGLNTYFTLSSIGKHFMNGLMKELKLNDYFDDRKNVNLNKFKYCPYCGNKIDWKELRNLGGLTYERENS